MRFTNSRLLLFILVALSLNACSTTTRPEDTVTPAELSSTSLATAPGSVPAAVETAVTPVVQAPVSVKPAEVAKDPEPQANTRSVPAAPPARKLSFDCTAGARVTGLVDRWSPVSTCPTGYQVTGLGRIDLQGDHNRPNLHVNDFICDDRGCKAWCIGDGCTVEARCCRISE